MAKETNIDSMKYRKSTHLAGVDVETIIAEHGKCVVTIKEAFYNTKVDVSGKLTDGYFLDFMENIKSMVVNSGNRKVIGSMVKELKNCTSTESRNVGNWTGLQIELYFDPTVTFGNKIVGGIKVKPPIKSLPFLVDSGKHYDNAVKSLKEGGSLDDIKKYYSLTEEIITKLQTDAAIK